MTTAIGDYSNAKGNSTTAIGDSSLATGTGTSALGIASFTAGYNTVASASYQTVVGQYNNQGNITNPFIVGIGSGAGGARDDGFKVTMSGSIILKKYGSAPTWTGVDGEIVFYQNAGTIRLYAWDGSAWKSSSFA